MSLIWERPENNIRVMRKPVIEVLFSFHHRCEQTILKSSRVSNFLFSLEHTYPCYQLNSIEHLSSFCHRLDKLRSKVFATINQVYRDASKQSLPSSSAPAAQATDPGPSAGAPGHVRSKLLILVRPIYPVY